MKTKQDNDMTNHMVQTMLKTKLSYYDRLDKVRSMKKTKQDNDVTNHISLVYTKNDIKPSRPIESSAVYDKNK